MAYYILWRIPLSSWSRHSESERPRIGRSRRYRGHSILSAGDTKPTGIQSMDISHRCARPQLFFLSGTNLRTKLHATKPSLARLDPHRFVHPRRFLKQTPGRNLHVIKHLHTSCRTVLKSAVCWPGEWWWESMAHSLKQGILGRANGISLRFSPGASRHRSASARHSPWCGTWIRMQRGGCKPFSGAAVEDKIRI
jgi:hypothetical protein